MWSKIRNWFRSIDPQWEVVDVVTVSSNSRDFTTFTMTRGRETEVIRNFWVSDEYAVYRNCYLDSNGHEINPRSDIRMGAIYRHYSRQREEAMVRRNNQILTDGIVATNTAISERSHPVEAKKKSIKGS